MWPRKSRYICEKRGTTKSNSTSVISTPKCNDHGRIDGHTDDLFAQFLQHVVVAQVFIQRFHETACALACHHAYQLAVPDGNSPTSRIATDSAFALDAVS